MHNLYEQFRQLIPDPPLQAGTVIDVGSGVVTVALPGGGRIKARGSAALGQKVFVRDDAIEGIAPSLTLEIIEIRNPTDSTLRPALMLTHRAGFAFLEKANDRT